ncbi:SDR family NAD(P)-dependent oxidoreductase [Haloechinothrix halophila]|uniref:SDR family NAD(P)-dependent oxidoreductase n=1 Tax=Haloechinothrix halophila TaxID=1069073 RepID=UPI000557FC0A|nr:SDR family oxidoreductase [Haloechinothrix halophila]
MSPREPAGVALVTGASRGIGAATARRLAADGMAVAINSYPDEAMLSVAKHVAAEIEHAGGRAVVYPADISDATAVDELFSRCEQELGPVTALVLNAAATGRESWTEITEDTWDRIMDVNLKGAFLCCRRAFGTDPPAPDGPGGTGSGGGIVTISSVLARLGAPNSLHYATTKAGILGFTRSLAQELGQRGIRVNCVVPGAIQTEEELEAYPDQDAVTATVLDNQILQRRGTADDVASVVSFLLGPDSDFITGQALTVDGGWTPL